MVSQISPLRVALRHSKRPPVLQQVDAGLAFHKVQPLGVQPGKSIDIQLIHLLLRRRNEQVARRALLNPGFEGA